MSDGIVSIPIVHIRLAFCCFVDQQFKPFLSKFSTQDEGEQVLDSLYEFRTPRNAILVIASEFISTSKRRLREINGKNPAQMPNLALDHESIQVTNLKLLFIRIKHMSSYVVSSIPMDFFV